MSVHLLFTDGSVDPARRLGVGVALAATADWLDREVGAFTAGDVAARCAFRRFEDTSSTRLEIECAVWALAEEVPAGGELTLFTDSQCVAGLPDRRERLEATRFVSGESGMELRHADLYREFYRQLDARPVRIVKLTGHADYRYQDAAQRIFHFVDREARRQLKRWLRERERAGEN